MDPKPRDQVIDQPAVVDPAAAVGSEGYGPLLPPVEVPQPEITVVVPTAWRAGRVLTDRMLHPDDFVVVCPIDQLAAYQEAQPRLRYDPYPHPESPEKWDWVLERYGSVMWLDDDLDRMMHLEHVRGEKECLLSKDETIDLFHRTAWEAAQLGAYLWCYGDNIINFNELNPFKLTGFVPSGCSGQLEGHGLWWHPDIVTGGDYWLSALNAHMHRVVLIDNRYAPGEPSQSTFQNPGGAARIRTMESERNDYALLKRYFGDAVVPKQNTGRAKIRHTYQRRLTLPF